MKVEKKSIKDVFGKVECYTSNIAELAGEIEDNLVEESGEKVVLDFSGWIQLFQIFWDKIKETALECEGKKVSVKLPPGVIGQIIGAAISFVGLRL